MKLALVIFLALSAAASAQKCGTKGLTPCIGANPCPGVEPFKQRLTPIDGVCTVCGLLDVPVCGDAPACNSATLVDFNGICSRCGRLSQPPCDGKTCAAGSTLSPKGTCELCGQNLMKPCPGTPCAPPLKLDGSVCSLCGTPKKNPCKVLFPTNQGCAPKVFLTKSSGLCEICGLQGRPPCDGKCKSTKLSVDTVDNIEQCVACGNPSQKPCSFGCNAPLVPTTVGPKKVVVCLKP